MRGSRAPLLVALLVAPLGCGERAHDPAGSRPLEVLVAQDAETLDPRFAVDATAARTARLVHAGLFRLAAEDLHPEPDLAESVTFDGPLAATITLKEGLRFHSGRPLTADDVVATIRALGDPTKAYRQRHAVAAIAAARAEGPRTVHLTLTRPRATLLSDLELPILRADEAASPPQPEGTLDGLGPFRVHAREPGATTLTPAPAAPGRPSPKHAVTIRAVRDENARALRLLAGRVDLAPQAFSPLLLPPLEARVPSARTMGANLTYLVPRVDRGPLADVHARRGLSLALDRARVAGTFFAGHAIAAEGLLPPRLWAHAPVPPEAQASSPFRFDREAARRELAAAGIDPAHPVRLTLLVSTDRFRGALARFFAQELGPLGVELSLDVVELGVLLERLTRGDFDVALLQMPELTEPNALMLFLHSAYVPPLGSNRGRVSDAALDRLLDEGDRTLDRGRRTAIYATLEERAREVVPIIPLFHEEQVALLGRGAAGFAPLPDGRLNGLANLE